MTSLHPPLPESPALKPATLFLSDCVVVRAYLGRAPGLCVVVFDPMGDDRSLERPAFGESYLGERRIDAVHVLSRANTWYQHAELPDALAAIRAVTAGYDRVVTYGSSMGGYAALRFAERCGANAAVAISPQYSLQGSLAVERRWGLCSDGLLWLHEPVGEPLPRLDEALVLYDPGGPDRKHADAIARDLPVTRLLPLPHAGHPAAPLLADMGLLADAMEDALRGRLDVPALQRAVRRGRARSAQFIFTLARRQPPHRLRLKLRLTERAIALIPLGERYSYAGLIEAVRGDDDAALALHRRAVEADPQPKLRTRLAFALLCAGRSEEARVMARRAAATVPPGSGAVELRALCALDHGPAAALDVLVQSPFLGLARRAPLWRRVLRRRPLVRRFVARLLGPPFVLALLRLTVATPAFKANELAVADSD